MTHRRPLLLAGTMLLSCSHCSNDSTTKLAGDAAIGDIAVADTTRTAAKPPTATIKVGKGPDALIADKDGTHVYVANVGTTTISIIRTSDHQVVGELAVAKGPWGFAPLSDTLIAVTSWEKQLNILDTATKKIAKTFALTFNAAGVVASSDGKLLYILAGADSKAHVVDPSDGSIKRSFNTGQGPDGIGIAPDNSALFIANTKDGTIQVLKTSDGSEINKFTVGDKPELIHRSHDGKHLFVSNFFANKVHIIDIAQRKIVGEIAGLDGPEEAVSSDDDALLYVANFNSSRVRVFRLSDRTEVDMQFKTGTKPIGVLPLGKRLYVTNHGEDSVTVYDLR